MEKASLSNYLNELQSKGRLYFLVSELEQALGMNKNSISASLSRLRKKSRLRMIKRGFGILLGAGGKEPDPSSYIDAMMKHLGANYYVGLLSAASHWGASHQASMSYQVFSDKVIKDIQFERGRIEFTTLRDMKHKKWIKKVSTTQGYFNISSPELTAIDIIIFYKKSGYFNNVATVLDELIERWDGRVMKSLCLNIYTPTIVLQRMGFILESILIREKEARYAKKALDARKPVIGTLTKLIKDKRMSDYPYNEKWKIYINTEVESD